MAGLGGVGVGGVGGSESSLGHVDTCGQASQSSQSRTNGSWGVCGGEGRMVGWQVKMAASCQEWVPGAVFWHSDF